MLVPGTQLQGNGKHQTTDESGVGAIENWKNHPRHMVAQRLGQEQWYEKFATRVCRVERHNL